ncbi:GntP family permease [Amnibacterium setariae]|uniref:Gluconate transporter n=1 Tax=Amnibacterium setariae TaxID=2306585 RepID=A0A3A1U1K3_9MICO|nr:gluconate:H+ symporter [Amnibacterium setariae]RIX26507.1 gluconate transporter [Amnibacterium setariae]
MQILLAAKATGSEPQLVIAALIGIAVIVTLITWLKVHPFLALLLGALTTGLVAGASGPDVVTSFAKGFGDTSASVGILIGLGGMYGRLLADSGGAGRIVDTLVARAGKRSLPWIMGLIGALIGLPMFFEIGLVLLVPIILLVAKRAQVRLMTVAIPTLAGLSAMHGFVPPHPGPLVAIAGLKADLGTTLLLGIVVAIPTVVVAGPLLSYLVRRLVPVDAPDSQYDEDTADDAVRPPFVLALISVLLPVALLLVGAIGDIVAPDSTAAWKSLTDFIGTPTVALTIALVAGFLLLALPARMDRRRISTTLTEALPPIAGILLIVGAGGGFKQVLVDTGIGEVIAKVAQGEGITALLVAWTVAALIRVATGSATVATVTAAGLLQPLTEGMSAPMISLMVLAVGAGSVFLSHVNDAGFWLVNQFFKLSIGQTLKSWSLMECVLSVTGLGAVLVAAVVVGG